MSGKSRLANALEKWVRKGGELDEMLPPEEEQSVSSRGDANAICAALDAFRADPERAGEVLLGTQLSTLVALFQEVDEKEALDALKEEGLPRLRSFMRDGLQGGQVEDDDMMFILKILAAYQQPEDIDLIAQAARKPIDPESFMWSVVFNEFDADHPFAQRMVDALRDPLPAKFTLVAYLDMANGLAVGGELGSHPFDTNTGRKQLESWLCDKDEENFSYAKSATVALPFIAEATRARLLTIAEMHQDASVRTEAAWVRAKGGDPTGLSRLSKLCLDVSQGGAARHYLEELGHADQVPEKARDPDFQALVEMADWLAHPNEYGRAPDAIELYDTRELYWPPTEDNRRVWLFKYTYNDEDDGEPEDGVGMVGSITFALLDDSTSEFSPEDIYGIHCCWELQMSEDSGAPEDCDAATGRAILARHNDRF